MLSSTSKALEVSQLASLNYWTRNVSKVSMILPFRSRSYRQGGRTNPMVQNVFLSKLTPQLQSCRALALLIYVLIKALVSSSDCTNVLMARIAI